MKRLMSRPCRIHGDDQNIIHKDVYLRKVKTVTSSEFAHKTATFQFTISKGKEFFTKYDEFVNNDDMFPDFYDEFSYYSLTYDLLDYIRLFLSERSIQMRERREREWKRAIHTHKYNISYDNWYAKHVHLFPEELYPEKYICNEQGCKYFLIRFISSGNFGGAFSACSLTDRSLCCIKCITEDYEPIYRNEVHILKFISENTTDEEKEYFLLYEDSFYYQDKFYLVTELLDLNLYDTIHYVFYDEGMLHSLTKLLFKALLVLKRLKIVHCDLKPENIAFRRGISFKLVKVKIIDFGCAKKVEGNHISYFYTQSRYYRASEVCLRLDFSFPVDVWSAILVILELMLKVPLLPGQNNYEMLYKFERHIGVLPASVLNKLTGETREYYNDDGTLKPTKHDFDSISDNFLYLSIDDNIRHYNPNFGGYSDKFKEKFLEFSHCCLVLDQEKRYTPEQLLEHSFCKDAP